MTTANYPANYKETEARAFKEADDYRKSTRPKRGSGIFEAINENLQAKDTISYQANEQRKTAKELAENYKRGSFKVSDDTTVMPGYTDPGFSVTQEGSAGFGGLIGTVGGAVLGGPLGIGAMQGAQLGGKIGSYF
tara:strand:+ start:14 stop:418 length:405 start_codon:yes stop_codon:yes gene_type:complete